MNLFYTIEFLGKTCMMMMMMIFNTVLSWDFFLSFSSVFEHRA